MAWTQTWKKLVYTGEEHRNTKTKNKTAKKSISRNRSVREANYYTRQEYNKTKLGKPNRTNKRSSKHSI